MEKSDDRESLRQSMERSDHPIMPENSTSMNIEEGTFAKMQLLASHLFTILIFPTDPLCLVGFGISSIFQLVLDPLFLYVPLINEDIKCVMLDHRLKIAVIVLRSWGDIRYLVRIIVRIKNGRRASHSVYKIVMTNAIDTVSLLPIPQVLILIFLPKMRSFSSLKIMKLLNSLIILQYLTRVYPIYIFCKQANGSNLNRKLRNRMKIKKRLVAINFLWYLLASHVLGAFLYFFSIEREINCWGYASRIENGSEFSTSCDENTFKNVTLLKNLCPINQPNVTVFDFGIFLYPLQSGMQESTNFSQKFFQCLSWGLRNLSSFASNLNASTYEWENFFVVVISISGLVLFIYLLGHMQEINKSDNLREHMKIIIELPEEMESKVNRVVKPVLEYNENFVLENMFSIFSASMFEEDQKEVYNLGMEIKYRLFMDKLKKVDGLKYQGEEVLKRIRELLEPRIYSEGGYIIREGEPLDMMFFITQGTGLTYATNIGSSGITQLEKEKDGLYGEELLTWAEGPSSKLSNLPISPIAVKSHMEVEVFALKALVLQFVTSEFRSDLNTDSSLTVVVNNEIVN